MNLDAGNAAVPKCRILFVNHNVDPMKNNPIQKIVFSAGGVPDSSRGRAFFASPRLLSGTPPALINSKAKVCSIDRVAGLPGCLILQEAVHVVFRELIPAVQEGQFDKKT
jgi:hypothetical protein